MKSRPILFSQFMASQAHSGNKTHTRRICAVQPPNHDYSIARTIISASHSEHEGRWHWFNSSVNESVRDFSQPHFDCPFGKVGDQLWVREPYYQRGRWLLAIGEKTKKGREKWCFMPEGKPTFDSPDGEVKLGRKHSGSLKTAWHKRLARFMPREYSRTTLEIVSIEIQWLQDIPEADCWNEGISDQERPLSSLASLCAAYPDTNIGALAADAPSLFVFGNDTKQRSDYEKVVGVQGRGCFAYLWESINGQGAWAANPAVWVIGFRRVES